MINKKYTILIVCALSLLIVITVIFSVVFNVKPWSINGNIVSNGKESYELGDYYDYDESNSGEITDIKDVKWKVMGALDGKLLIISSTSVGELSLGNDSDIVSSQNDYLNGHRKIDEICEKYSHGKGATGYRSVNYKDITNAFNIDYNNYINSDEKIYAWGSNKKLISYSLNDSNNKKESSNSDRFVWYDELNKEWKTSFPSVSASNDNLEKISKFSENLVVLNSLTYNSNTKDYVDTFIGNEKIKKMFFEDDMIPVNSYWTSDNFTTLKSNFVGYGYNVVKSDTLNYTYLVYSVGVSRESTFGVRAVISIK